MVCCLNENEIKLLKKIEHIGHKAYISGAAARELILKNAPQCYTVVTDAPLNKLKLIFRNSVNSHERKNCLTVIENKTSYDIFYPDANDDADNKIYSVLSGFDFTLNTLAISSDGEAYDYFNAMYDIENKLVRFTLNSYNMIFQNPIIMLRAIRYCIELDFELEPATAHNIRKCSVLIKKAKSTSVREEFDKMLMCENTLKLMKIYELGLMRYLLPELDVCFDVAQKNKYHIYNVGEHIIRAVYEACSDLTVKWAALLHDIGKPECKSIDSNGIIHFYGHHRESVKLAGEVLRRLNADNLLASDVLTLIENHDVRIEPTPVCVKRMMSRTGGELFEKLLELQEADNKAKNMKYFNDKYNKLCEVRSIYMKIIAQRQPYRINDLAIGSRELIKLGFKTGHEIGDTLQRLLEEVFIDASLNNREYLISKAKQMRKKK